MDLVTLLVALIVIGLVFWAVREIASAFAIPKPIVVVVQVALVLVVVLWLLRAFAPGLTIGR